MFALKQAAALISKNRCQVTASELPAATISIKRHLSSLLMHRPSPAIDRQCAVVRSITADQKPNMIFGLQARSFGYIARNPSVLRKALSKSIKLTSITAPPPAHFQVRGYSLEQLEDSLQLPKFEKKVLIIHPSRAGQISEQQKKKLLVETRPSFPDFRLKEAESLVRSLNWEIVGSSVVNLHGRPGPTFFGSGKTQEIINQVKELGANILFVDSVLSGTQHRNLEDALRKEKGHENFRVLDRYSLILEIFQHRATSKETKMQLELAALEYAKARLIHAHDSEFRKQQQEGAIGVKSGFGETQLERERRIIENRIKEIKKQLSHVKTQKLHMEDRKAHHLPVIALVGYTNSGKSALMNHLTGSHFESDDSPFTSLEPRHRKVVLPSGQKAVLVDTIGFISDVPHALIPAFHSSLSEIVHADMIIHVRDISSDETERQKRDVLDLLGHLLAHEDKRLDKRYMLTEPVTMIEVWNKIDLLSPEELKERIKAAHAPTINIHPIVPVSALYGTNCDTLLQRINENLMDLFGAEAYEVEFDGTDQEQLHWLFHNATVMRQEAVKDGANLKLQVIIPSKELAEIFKAQFTRVALRRIAIPRHHGPPAQCQGKTHLHARGRRVRANQAHGLGNGRKTTSIINIISRSNNIAI